MNFLARILSHGFAIAVVLLIAAGLINRGELFPDMPMPGFLGFEKHSAAGPDVATAPDTTVTEAEADAAASTDEVTAPAMPTQAADTGGTAALPVLLDEPDTTGSAAAAVDEVPAAGEADTVTEADTGIPAPALTHTAESRAETQTPPPPAAAPAEVATPAEEASVEPAAPETPASQQAAEPTSMEPAAPVVTSVPEMETEPAPVVTDIVEADEVAPVVEAPPAEALTEPPPPVVETEPALSAPVTYAAEAAAPASDDQPDAAAIPEPGAPAMDAAPAAQPAVVATLDMTRPYHVLAAAREAYWMRNPAEAESLYRQLIDLDPDNPDGYGELGNLYFSEGRWEEAASAYFEAGSRLARTGHIMEAENLLEVIRGLDGSQADELAGIIAESR